MGNRRGSWPGIDFRGMSLSEVRQRIRDDGGGQPPPPGQQPEHISKVLARIGFGGQRRHDDEHEALQP